MRSVEDACGDGLSDKMLCACERYRCTYIYIERSINILYTHRWAETESDTETEAERER